jgi:hypothetical protein
MSIQGMLNSTEIIIIKKKNMIILLIFLLSYHINIDFRDRKYNLKKKLSNCYIINHNFNIFCLILLEKFFRDINQNTC